jgi:hypothetical protein
VRSDLPGHEHFGFDDGVSQPGPRGRASDRPGDHITDRHIDPGQVPQSLLYGYPGQDLVWPGEFVLGYPATGPDPLLPGPVALAQPPWTRNGSFLVYRRLRQDVGLFWRTMRSEAARLAALPGFAELKDNDEALAARPGCGFAGIGIAVCAGLFRFGEVHSLCALQQPLVRKRRQPWRRSPMIVNWVCRVESCPGRIGSFEQSCSTARPDSP